MRPILALLILLLPLAARAEPPHVVTDIPVIQALVAEVLGAEGTVDTLLERGADAHDFQLRASQARALQEANLVVWVGPELTPWLARAPGQAPSLRLLSTEGTSLRHYEDGSLDPHAWLNPANAATWLGHIANDLAKIDPENAAVYLSRAATGQSRIAALQTELAGVLASAANKPFVVYHDAYGYFSETFALQIAGSVAAGDAASPGASRVAELRRLMTGGGAVCIFPDAEEGAAPVQVLAEGTGVRIGAALDATGSFVTGPPGAGYYDAVLRGLATALSACLSAE